MARPKLTQDKITIGTNAQQNTDSAALKTRAESTMDYNTIHFAHHQTPESLINTIKDQIKFAKSPTSVKIQ